MKMSPTGPSLSFLPKRVLGTALLLWHLSPSCLGQNFDPNVRDKEYLDTIQTRLQQESLTAHDVLVNQTKILQQVTRTFIESKIKENLFKAVRERVELELEEMSKGNVSTTPVPSSSNSSRQARQDEEEDEEATTASAPPPRPGLLPQLASVVTTLFGSNVNVTGFVKDSTAFLPQDLSSRIVSAASLIDPNRFTSTSTPPPLIINGQVIPQSALTNGSYVLTHVDTGSPALLATNPQALAAAVPIPQSGSLNGVSGNGNSNNLVLQPANVGAQAFYQQPDVSTYVPQAPQPSNIAQQQQQNYPSPSTNTKSEVVGQQSNLIAPAPLAQPGTVEQQQQNYNNAAPAAPLQSASAQFFSNSVVGANWKDPQRIAPLVPLPSAAPLAFSNEEDDYSSEKGASASKNQQNEEDSSEDDLPVARADLQADDNSGNELPSQDEPIAASKDDPLNTQNLGYLDEYPAVKYAIRLFNHFASRQTIPTTTEFVPTTTFNATLEDYLDEEEVVTRPRKPTPPPTRYQQVVMGGQAIWQGAKDAYKLLQQLNGYFDKINTRLENAGYGAEDVGVDLK